MTKTVKSNTAHFLAETAQVDAAAVAPLPGSRKVYVEGSRPDIRVPFREITLSPTKTSGVDEQNPPLAGRSREHRTGQDQSRCRCLEEGASVHQ